MSKPFIEVKNLTKYYKMKVQKRAFRNLLFPTYEDFLAIKDISFDIKRNEIFGILGPNGAGKTTTIKCLCGLLAPTSGTIIIDNYDVVKYFFKIQTMAGTMFGNTMIYYRLTGYDNLKYYCRVYNIENFKERVDYLIKLVDLEKWKHQLVENYSLGMKSKLALARALVHDPEILLLDEPTLGLDPKNSLFIRQLLKKMEKTIIITTHNLEVANDVCSRIALLKDGEIITIDTPKKLRKSVFSSHILEVETPEEEKIINEVRGLDFIEEINQIEDYKIQIRYKFEENLNKILAIISKNKINSLKNIVPSLEDAFFKFTGEK
ncbi:MAG: ATP-binding cassette domain-containing protein [Candidatus Hodarchaeota archaeon]